MDSKQYKLKSFLRASWSRKVEAIGILFLYYRVSIITRLFPLRLYYDKYFQEKNDQSIDLLQHERTIARIRKILYNLPGKHTCLKECIVVHLYFKHKGIYVPLYVGVKVKHGFQAHAWYDSEKSNNFCPVEHKSNERIKDNEKKVVET